PRNCTAHDVSDVVHAGLQGCQSHRLQCVEDRRDRLDLDVAQLHLLARRQVDQAVAMSLRDCREGPQLIRTRHSIRNTDPDHEETWGRVTQKQSVPFEPLYIAFGDALPSGLRVARDGFPHVQAVALLFQGFYRVHAIGSFPSPGASDSSGTLSGTVRVMVTGLASQYNPPTNTPPPMILTATTQSWFQA